MQIDCTAPCAELFSSLRRVSDSHKGLYGSVAIYGGAVGMAGAALLAGRAALHLGCGKVWLGVLDRNIRFDPLQPELMIRPATGLLQQQTPSHILIGPGLGSSPVAQQLLADCLLTDLPLIIDADGLNLIAQQSALKAQLQTRAGSTVITPHPSEAARLLNISTTEVQENRSQAAFALIQQFNCHIVLKGHHTLICSSPTTLWQNTSGNPALSSAGQGDVLGGIILALWAQGLSPLNASRCGVYLHGTAADAWRADQPNAIGLTASETILLARKQLNTILSDLP